MNEQTPAAIPPPPREVRRKMGTGCEVGCVRLFILPHTVAGIVLVLLVAMRSYVILVGTPTQATVDRAEYRSSRKGRGHYYVWFHYQLNGRRIDSSDPWPSSAPTPHAGDQFAGRAAAFPGNTMFLRASQQSLAADVLPIAIFAVFWNAFIAVFVYAAWVRPIQTRWLVMYGEAAPGVVTSWVRSRGRNQSMSTVGYSFTTPDGVERSGKYWTRRRDALAAGERITVLYNPKRPRQNLPYEVSDFIVSGVGDAL
jgi:hypothetical protein